MNIHAHGTQRLEALVVLGCGLRRDGQPCATLTRRIITAAAAARRLDVPWVIATGGRRWHGVAEADAMVLGLSALGVPEERLLREPHSLSTLENAQFTARLVAMREIRAVGVVTCDWHMRRAIACFEHAGLAVHPLPASSPPVSIGRAALRASRERARWWLTRAEPHFGRGR